MKWILQTGSTAQFLKTNIVLPLWIISIGIEGYSSLIVFKATERSTRAKPPYTHPTPALGHQRAWLMPSQCYNQLWIWLKIICSLKSCKATFHRKRVVGDWTKNAQFHWVQQGGLRGQIFPSTWQAEPPPLVKKYYLLGSLNQLQQIWIYVSMD